ncbi:MAG: SDR family oxidoreductase [Candidatus Cloacimonadota bacterium]|nr:MAG: SDR family oxidoreductase [Candidatus Cloacimonadota bacterium]
MRVLITGMTGFVGSHLADYLLDKGDVEVYGIVRWRSQKENIEHLEGKVKLFECDIKDMTSVHDVVKSVKPERIFHLAAQSFVPASWNAPAETLSTNIIGELNIFESVRQIGLDTIIHIAGSSEEYGLVKPDEIPITENNPLRPLSPYGVSKVAQDLLGYQYFKSYGMRIIRTRAFNHTGPRRGEVFVCSTFAKQIAEIEKGIKEPVLLVGNLEAERDFTDVRDVVKAYWLAAEKCEPGEIYNISSGNPRTIQSVLDTLLSFTDVKVEVKKDPARMRPSDVPILKGDSSKFREKTGWKPEIPFEQTLKDTLEYWRERL